jgi:hypothetical protein
MQLEERLEVLIYRDKSGKCRLTEKYLLGKGACCGCGCMHCPYEPRWERGETTVSEHLKAKGLLN